jgi:hypothetical protein
MENQTLKFKAFFGGKQPIEITTAKSAYEAQCMAATLWNLKPSKRHMVHVVLCEVDGRQIIHSAGSL